MTDISHVSETPSMTELVPNEELSYETVETLCTQAEEAIENNAPERAIEILIALDKGQCKGNIKPSQNFEIIHKLWTLDPHIGQKLLGIEFQTFTISVEGNHVYCKSINGTSSRSFSFEYKTTQEGEELLEKAFNLFKEKELTAFEKSLREALEMHREQHISDRDIVFFVEELCRKNIVTAERFFPLMNEFLKVGFEEETLVMQANRFNRIAPEHFFAFKDVDRALKMILDEEDSEERMEMYVKLASMHEGRSIEILKLAESEIPKLVFFEQIDAIKAIAEGYIECNDVESAKALKPKLEAVGSKMVEIMKCMKSLLVVSHEAKIALAEKDKDSFKTHLGALKSLYSQVPMQDEDKEDVKREIVEIEEKGEKVFPTDPLVLKEQKV